jgi:NAD-dependent dihydropyrimidine dehydrogenase PreA subunit
MARRIDRELCVNCGACEGVCPASVISEKEDKRFIDESACIDCGACESVCPTSAISAV